MAAINKIKRRGTRTPLSYETKRHRAKFVRSFDPTPQSHGPLRHACVRFNNEFFRRPVWVSKISAFISVRHDFSQGNRQTRISNPENSDADRDNFKSNEGFVLPPQAACRPRPGLVT